MGGGKGACQPASERCVDHFVARTVRIHDRFEIWRAGGTGQSAVTPELSRIIISETKKPAAGGGAAGFSKELNNGWEEECRRSVRRPLGGGMGRLKHEALREEVHCFDVLKIPEAAPIASA